MHPGHIRHFLWAHRAADVSGAAGAARLRDGSLPGAGITTDTLTQARTNTHKHAHTQHTHLGFAVPESRAEYHRTELDPGSDLHNAVRVPPGRRQRPGHTKGERTHAHTRT